MKNIRILTGMLLLLSLSVVSASPAKAALKEPQLQHHQPEHQENTDKDSRLLSQATEQMNSSEYKVGRVVGKTGNILFIVLKDGTSFRIIGDAQPGEELLLSESEGSYVIVEKVTRQASSTTSVTTSGSLSSRTAGIWQEIESSSSRTTITPPPPQPAPSYSAPASTYSAPAPTYQEAPVRALW